MLFPLQMQKKKQKNIDVEKKTFQQINWETHIDI